MGCQRVVQQMLRRAVVGVGRAGDQYDGKILGIGAGNGVDGGKTADAECYHRGGGAVGTCIAFGAVTAVQFIAAVDLFQILVRQQLVEQDQIEIAGDGEVMF